MKRIDGSTLGTRRWFNALALVCVLVAPAASASERLDEATIRTMMRELNRAAAARDVSAWEARLAPECDIAMQVTVFGTLKTVHFSRREYLEMTRKAWGELDKYKVAYDYAAGPISVRLDAGVAVVSGKTTETLTYPDGQKLATSSLNTMRIEARGERLQIVSVNAVAEL